MIKEWLKTKPKGLDIDDTHVNTLLFADDQVVFADNEGDLQRELYNLQKVADKYGMRISSSKTKVMDVEGKEPIRSKIVVNGLPVEQVRSLKYLGVSGAINRAIPPRKVRAETQIRTYNMLARQMLLYGSKTWTTRKDIKSRVTAVEMRFMRATTGCMRRDRKRNEDILNELGAEPILRWVKDYRKK
ncbi:uncharacterized protein LOC135839116 [Planococcus citri]|uniref:uncharacterized protein LOC135839116 n=1 Tax=Planococcus citri TaxID=170843 RepID=UPI0031F8D37B